MTGQTLIDTQAVSHRDRHLPKTPRGRALFTVDWFTNGSVRKRNHDNPRVQLAGRHAR